MKENRDKKHDLVMGVVASLIKDYQNKNIDVSNGHVECDFFDSGNYALNYILSGDFDNGWPVGQIINVHGLSQTGKSFLIYNAIANFLKKYDDGVVILDDAEWAYVDFLGSNLGIDASRFMKFSHSSIEEHYKVIFGGGFEEDKDDKDCKLNKNSLIYALYNNGIKHIMVAVDSIAAWSTDHERVVGLDKPDMSKAKMVKALFRNVTPYIKHCGLTYMVTNHLIVNIGDMFGPKYVEGSGNAPAYNATVRLCLTAAGKLKNKSNDDIIGVISKAQTVKNRFAPPFRTCELEIDFNNGLSKYSGLVPLLKTLGVFEVCSGGWYKVSGTDIKFQEKQLPEKWNEIRKVISKDKLKLRNVVSEISRESYDKTATNSSNTVAS